MVQDNSLFSAFRRMYNKTIKDTLNLPFRAPHEKVDTLMGVQNAINIIQSSFLRNYGLWQKEYDGQDSDREFGQ